MSYIDYHENNEERVSHEFLHNFLDSLRTIDGVDDFLPVKRLTRITTAFGIDKKLPGNDIPEIHISTTQSSPLAVRIQLSVSINPRAHTQHVGHLIEEKAWKMWKTGKEKYSLPQLDGIDIRILAVGW